MVPAVRHRSVPEPDDPAAARILLVLVIVAFALRAGTACLTVDIPGDGPSRSVLAYQWSLSPTFIKAGIWTPGLTYLAGLACMLIPDPRIAPRLLNVLLGSASIPLLCLVTRRVYGTTTGLIAAGLLAIFPLHVGLSASSLSEAAFVFSVLAMLVCAFGAAERDGSPARPWIAGIVAFGVLGEMLRYEAWLLVPFVVAYVAYRRRSLVVGLGLALPLLCFPVLWSLQNYTETGDIALGFTKSVSGTEGAAAVSPWEAAPLFWRLGRSYLGTAAALIIVAASASTAIEIARRKASPEQALLALLLAISWAVIYGLVLRRGTLVWGRYGILGYVLAFPFAVAWTRRIVPNQRIQAAVAAICLILLAVTYFENHPSHPTVYVKARRPPQIAQLIEWRKASVYRDDAIILTAMDWNATYVPQIALDLVPRSIVVARSSSEAHLREFAAAQHPALLVTQPEDAPLRTRVEEVLGGKIGPEHLVHSVDRIQVFDIRHLTRRTEGESQGAPPRP